MKKAVVFLITIMILTVACNQEQPVNLNPNEKVLSITHGRYYGECIGYCEKYLIITKDSIEVYYRGWDGYGIDLPDTLWAKFNIENNIWNSLISSFSVNDFMKLDSIYPPLGEVDQGHTYIKVITNLRTKSVSFTEPDTIIGTQELDKILFDIRDFYGISK
jgi:hypothetical protein